MAAPSKCCMCVGIPCGMQLIVFWTNITFVMSIAYLYMTVEFAIAPRPDDNECAGSLSLGYLPNIIASTNDKEFDVEAIYR